MEAPSPVDAQGETLRRMEAAENYNRWLFERARPYLGRSVLDVGAGIGTFVALAAPGRERVVAAEPDPDFARLLEERFAAHPNVEVISSSADAVAPDERVESIICFNVLEHIRDDSAALRRFFEVLAPGGCLLLLVPAHAFLFGAVDRAVGHERRYRKPALGALLSLCGFEVEDLRYVNPVGAVGWLVSSRVLRSEDIPTGPLRAYDRFVPLIAKLDALHLPFGLSLWAVARKPPATDPRPEPASGQEDERARNQERNHGERMEDERSRESL
jgi:SAM-dependent methyltransferase